MPDDRDKFGLNTAAQQTIGQSADPKLGRPQPRNGQRQRIVPDNQPTLRGRVSARRPVIGHRPIADFGVRQIVEAQAPADPAAPVVDDDLQQPVAKRLRGLLTWTRWGTPRSKTLLFNVFPHARGVAPLGATGQYPAEIITAVHGPVNGEVR